MGHSCPLSPLLLLLLSSLLFLPALAGRPNLGSTAAASTSPDEKKPVLLPPKSNLLGFFEGGKQLVTCQDGKPIKGLQAWWGELSNTLPYGEPVITGVSLICTGGQMAVETGAAVAVMPDSTVFGHATNVTRRCECETGGFTSITWRRAQFEEWESNGELDDEDDLEIMKSNRFVGGMIIHCLAESSEESDDDDAEDTALVADLTDQEVDDLEGSYQLMLVCPTESNQPIMSMNVLGSAARWAGFEVEKCSAS